MTGRSCDTYTWADTTLRDGELVMECHLNPPMTMPPAPEVPVDPAEEFPLGPDYDLGGVTIEAFAEPHRYPVVTETDWCSFHRLPTP
mgnify:FL=1